MDLFAKLRTCFIAVVFDLLLDSCGRGVVRGDKGDIAVLCRKLSTAGRATCVEQHRPRLHTMRLAKSGFQIIVFAFVIKTFSLRPQAVEHVYPLFCELEPITMLLHLISKKLHVWRIPSEDEVHSSAAIGDEIDGRLRLGYEDWMVERDMHCADDTDMRRHGSDGSGPSKRLHQVAAVVVVAPKRLPVCCRDEGLKTKFFGLLRQSYVRVPGAFEAIRMKSEGSAVAVSGEDAKFDAIFGIADGVRFRGFPIGHFRSIVLLS